MREATSIFVGGGTPSLVAPDLLARVIGKIPRVANAEITVECNPDSVTPELVEVYADAGVNRISLGVQSMDPRILRALGRTHDPQNVARALDLIRSGGFREFNLDLIYGTVGESLDTWRATIEAALGFDPPHISAYALTVETGTPLARDRSRHPDDDDLADKYLVVDDILSGAGLEWYEISNWARPSHECRHNRLYWDQGDYLGFGCAAHSHESGHRWWNMRLPERYIEAVETGAPTIAGEEHLNFETRRLERLDLALRTSVGVPASSFTDEDLVLLEDLIELRGDRVVLQPRGRLLANEVIMRLQ